MIIGRRIGKWFAAVEVRPRHVLILLWIVLLAFGALMAVIGDVFHRAGLMN